MNYLAPCPNCGTLERTQWFHRKDSPIVDIMCWEYCGMDFAVTYVWWMLNRVEVAEDA